MGEAGLISVIVAVYNIKEYLGRCVDSILGQSYGKLEIILVDDGSADGSGEICDRYGEQDQRIKVIHKENGGLSDARNAGLAVAGGTYIGYVNGDDYIEPGMYEALYEAMTAERAQVAVCRYRQIGEGAHNGEFSGRVVGLSGAEALEIYICGHREHLIYPSVWSKLFDRDTVAQIKFAVGKSSEDIMYTTEALCRASRCVYVDTPYYNYIVDRKDSIMNQKAGARRFEFEIPNWREQAEFLRQEGREELAEKSEYYFYRKMLFYYIEFREDGQKQYARRLAGMLRGERERIKAVYGRPWAVRGDRARMKLMLAAPGGYYRVVKLYDRWMIPLRLKIGNAVPRPNRKIGKQ